MNKQARLRILYNGYKITKQAGIPSAVFKSFASRLSDKFMDIANMLKELQVNIKDW